MTRPSSRPILISPSLLSADFAELGQEVRSISQAGADWIHIDVMDGHFVPNLTIGPMVVQALRPHSTLPFDVHLMIQPTDGLIPAFAKAGADIITIHAEASIHLDRSLQLIKETGKKIGVSLVPSSPSGLIDYVLDQVDLILVMTVNPGFGGQAFLPSQLAKIQELRQKIDRTGRPIHLEVDGGIQAHNAGSVIEHGADVLVAGSAIFKGNPSDYAKNILALRTQNSAA
jgi:ribulose-phosphate 3-epimerase